MVNTGKKNLWILLALGAVLLTLLCVVVVSADSTFDIKVDFESKYAVGTKVTIPAAKFKVQGKTLDTTITLIGPSGAQIPAADYANGTYTVKNKGAHKVVYTADNGGTQLREEFDFVGYYPLYSVGKKASAEPYFGASTKYGGIDGRDGVVVSLASGDTFQWGEIIDLKGKTQLDDLVQLYVTPNTLGTADAAKLCIVLTDIHDPDNYVTITFKKVTAVMVGAQWAEINTFVTAGSAEQLQSGMRENASGTISYEGTLYNIEAGTKMGTEIKALSLPGTPMYVQGDASTISEQHFKNNPQLITVSFDYANSKVFAGRIDANETDPEKSRDVKFVADLDAEECFDTLWGGFTTGEVYLSIKGQEYLSSSLNFVVTEVNGESVASKVQSGENTVNDTTPPSLEVDFPAVLPEGAVGAAYPLFPARASDIYDGEIIPEIIVTFNAENVSVENGAFTPVQAGVYAITYRATDYSGNHTTDSLYTKYVTVAAGNELSVTLSEKATTGFVTGTQIPVAAYTAADARGEVSAVVTATLVKNASGQAATGSVVYTAENGAFVALEAGTYKIEYVVSDYVFTKTVSYDISVDANSGAVIVNDPELPMYYISGMIYSTPELKGYYWESGVCKEAACAVSYSEDGVSYTESGTLFAPVGDGTGYLKFTVEAGGKTAEKIVEVKIIDVGYNQNKLSLDKYFHFTKGSASSASDGKKISYTLEGNASLDFVNLLQAESFSFEFEPNGLSSVQITLTDAQGNRLTVRYTYLNNGKTTVEVISGEASKTITLNYDIHSTEKGTQRLSYDNESRKLNVTAKRSIDLADLFAGFTSSVWMTVDVTAANTNTTPTFSVYSLNEQRFATLLADDRVAPLILVNIAIGERKIDEIFHLDSCVVSDVLDSYCVSYMYVLSPSGAYATAVDGTILDYTADFSREYDIKLNEYGKYIIYYYAKDSAGNDKNYTVQIAVVDSEAPVITTSEHDRSVKVGDVITPAEFTVSDNISTNEQITKYVYVTAPDGTTLTGGEAKATKAGVYQIHYYAIDAQGNCSVLVFRVTAS